MGYAAHIYLERGMLSMMNKDELLTALRRLKLPLPFSLDTLEEKELMALYKDSLRFNWPRFHEARASFLGDKRNPQKHSTTAFKPCQAKEAASSSTKKRLNIGIVILAGGQATRMGLPEGMPKALLPTTPVINKTLLQINIEKALAFKQLNDADVSIAFFVSESTYSPIKKALEENNYYGFNPEHILFGVQPSLPFLSKSGELILTPEGKIMGGPDGNGSILYTLEKASILTQWQSMGVEIVTVINIDNPLIDPFYPPLINAVLNGEESTLAFSAIEKSSDNEKVGLFARRVDTEGLCVIEYSEIQQMREMISPYTLCDFNLANISHCAFKLSWAHSNARRSLPWHAAEKQSNGFQYYKMEQFIFDLLDFALFGEIVFIEREFYFAPIKNKTGEDSLETAKKKIEIRDKERLFQLLSLAEEQEEKSEEKSVKLRSYINSIGTIELDPFWLYYLPTHSIHQYEILSCLSSNGYLEPLNSTVK